MTAFIVAVLVMLCEANALAGDTGKSAQGNVFISSPVLPAALKRVVVLPLACDESSRDLSGGCQTLDPVLQAGLVKAGKFEVVIAQPETIRNCTGKLSWTGAEVLPADFFSGLKNVYGCDAVLFSQLTEFRPNEPLAIGWRMKLVDAGTGKILWATDEIFDAGNLDVAKSAQQFEKSRQPHQGFMADTVAFLGWCIHTPTRSALDEQWNILHSPRYFGEYSVEKVLETLPQR